ncbi:MAG: glycosyltransferase [Adhaeribacter sp.]
MNTGIKKILFAVTTDLNYDQRMQRICRSLQQAGYAVTLVGRQWPHSQPLQTQVYQQHRLSCRFTRGKLFYLEYNLRLALFLWPRRDDAFVAIDLDTALPVYGKARLSGKPFVYDAHEYFPETPEVVRRRWVKRLWQGVEAFVLPRTRFAYTVSNSIARLLQAQYRVPVALIRNLPLRAAPDCSGRPLPAWVPQEPFILYQGALNEGRGLEQLLQAMPQVPMPLLLCGEGDLLGSLRRQVQQLGLQHRVTFAGYVLPADLARITPHAHVGIMLLANAGKSYYYSLANKFFDYIQAGVPQLLPDFPEYRTLNEQYQVGLYCGLEPDRIARALNQLAADPALHAKLVRHCRQASSQLCWQKEEKKLTAFYEKIWK